MTCGSRIKGMGRLATRREAGTTIEFKYNTEEDLTGIVNEHGHAYRFDLDERGDVAREYGFDDIRRVYTRDDNAGRVIRVEQSVRTDHILRVRSCRSSDRSEAQ